MADKLRDGSRIRGGSTGGFRSGEPPRGIARLLGVEGGRRAMTAVVVGLVGVAAFVASLLVDWLRVTVAPSPEYGIQGGEYAFDLAMSEYAVVYPIGVLGLLTMVGLGLTRPDVARRLRLAAVALGIGLAGVVMATVNELRDATADGIAYPVFFMGDIPGALEELVAGQTYTPLPGQMLAFGTVVLLVVAAWLAGGPARTGLAAATAVAAAPGSSVAHDPAAAPVSPAPQADEATGVSSAGEPLDHRSPVAGATRVGYVDDLTVMTSDAIDLGGQADILRN